MFYEFFMNKSEKSEEEGENDDEIHTYNLTNYEVEDYIEEKINSD